MKYPRIKFDDKIKRLTTSDNMAGSSKKLSNQFDDEKNNKNSAEIEHKNNSNSPYKEKSNAACTKSKSSRSDLIIVSVEEEKVNVN